MHVVFPLRANQANVFIKSTTRIATNADSLVGRSGVHQHAVSANVTPTGHNAD